MGAVSDPEQLVRAVAAAGVGDPRVIDAVRAFPGAGFVPPRLAWRAYRDEPLPIPRGQVTTQPSLVARMGEALGLTGSGRVLEVGEGDGTEGLSEHAPYDAILVAAAFPSVPRPLEEQLAVGGRLVQPLGPGGTEEVVLFKRGSRNLVRLQVVAWASFVRLPGAHAFPEE